MSTATYYSGVTTKSIEPAGSRGSKVFVTSLQLLRAAKRLAADGIVPATGGWFAKLPYLIGSTDRFWSVGALVIPMDGAKMCGGDVADLCEAFGRKYELDRVDVVSVTTGGAHAIETCRTEGVYYADLHRRAA